MYKILRFSKRFNSKKFDSYETARQYVRKWVRKHFDYPGHPKLSEWGFSIKTV